MLFVHKIRQLLHEKNIYDRFMASHSHHHLWNPHYRITFNQDKNQYTVLPFHAKRNNQTHILY
jgi:hypothetical protein